MAQRGDGLGRIGTEGVAGVEVAGGQVVESHPKAGDAGFCRRNSVRKQNRELMEESFIAEQAVAAFHLGGKASAGKNLHVLRWLPNQTALPRSIHHSVRQWMVGPLLGCRGHAEQIVLIVASEWVNASQHGAAHGEGSGLVEDDCVQVRQPFQRFSTLEEHTELRAATHGHRERRGNGQSHGAGAGNHQHGYRVGQGQRKRVRREEPNGKRDHRQSQHDGNKDGAGAVGQPLHGGARGLRLLNHAGDLSQHRGLAQRLSPAGDGAVVVERAGQSLAAGFARLRGWFAGEHRLVHGGAAFEDGGVDREALSGQDQNAVSGLNLCQGNNGFDFVADAASRDGAQPGERVERGQGAAFGAGFKRLAQQQKADDQQNRVKVDLAAVCGPDRCIS